MKVSVEVDIDSVLADMRAEFTKDRAFNRRINMIKAIRSATSCSLLEGKMIVDILTLSDIDRETVNRVLNAFRSASSYNT